MKKHFQNTIVLLLFFLATCQASSGQKLDYIKVPELEKILKNPENKLFVVNLWATWCPPCVRELPDFEKVAKFYSVSRVQFIMISLDFPSQVEKQLIPFLKKNNISLDVSLMTDVDYNSWINKVDSSWQGDIPATLIFNNSQKIRHFHSGELSEKDLRKLIDTFII
jgi:thiol-disulfide isomerase/thioredoxin